MRLCGWMQTVTQSRNLPDCLGLLTLSVLETLSVQGKRHRDSVHRQAGRQHNTMEEGQMSNERKNTKTGSTFAQRLVMVSCTALVLLSILIGAAWGLHRLALANTSHGGAVGWALAATSLLPVMGYACYRLGQIEGRGVMNGIAAGVGVVSKQANDIAQVKVGTARALRQPMPVYPAALPDQIIVDIAPEPGGGGPVYM